MEESLSDEAFKPLEAEEDEEDGIQNGGVFCPVSLVIQDIEQILWKKEEMYLVKYKGHSYLHLDWICYEEVISAGKVSRRESAGASQ